MAPLSLLRLAVIGSALTTGAWAQANSVRSLLGVASAAPTSAPSSAPTFAPSQAPTLAPTLSKVTLSPTMAPVSMVTPGLIHIEAEDFNGGEGVGYFVSTVSADKPANAIRTDENVTIATLVVPEGAPAEYSVRAVASGDWFRYTINVDTAGTYTPTYHIAAYDALFTGTLLEDIKIVLDGGLSADPCAEVGVGELNITPINTGDWRIFQDFSGAAFDLPAGAGQVITVCLVDVTNFEFDYLTLAM